MCPLRQIRKQVKTGTAAIALLWFICASHSAAQTNQPPLQAALQAIDDNNLAALETLLARSTNWLREANYQARRHPLLQAAADGRLEMVRRLLASGADPNVVGDIRIKSPAQTNRYGVMGRDSSTTSDASHTAGARTTALQYAAGQGHWEVCQWLLKAGADPNFAAAFRPPPLIKAYQAPTGQTAVAELLLDCGANPFIEAAGEPRTAFDADLLANKGRLFARMLGQDAAHPLGTKRLAGINSGKFQGRPVKTAPEFLAEHGVRLFSLAMQHGSLEAARALLQAGVPATSHSADGLALFQNLALFEAEASKNANYRPAYWQEMRQLLLDHGANYDAFSATALGDTNQLGRLAAEHPQGPGRDATGQTPLHWAVRVNRPTLTDFWIRSGIPLEAENLAGQTALHLAASLGLVEHVKLLLAVQAPLEIRDTNGWTPLDAATQAKQIAVIRLFLTAPGAAYSPERGLATALHTAAVAGDLEAMAKLTNLTASLEARDELGLTPLQSAVANGQLAAAAWLINQGAKVAARDPQGNTLLHQVILPGNAVGCTLPPAEWIASLTQNPNLKLYAEYLAPAPDAEAPNPVLQAVSFVLACGVDASLRNNAGKTAIELALDEEYSTRLMLFDEDQAKLMKLMQAGGGNLNAADTEGNTPLHLVGGDVDSEKARGLIAAGADINATNHLGQTPLHRLAESIHGWDESEAGDNQPFQLLLRSHANVNLQDLKGRTPLHSLLASDSDFKAEAIRALIAAGANPNLCDEYGRTPAHLLLASEQSWHSAGECMKPLIQGGADFSLKDQQGKNPLHYFAGNQSPFFVVRGVGDAFEGVKLDPNARDNGGNTPLHVAARAGSGLVDWLVQLGGNLDAKNNAGETPRLLLARKSDGYPQLGPTSADTDIFVAARLGKIDSLDALLKADSQLLNLTNRMGETPLRVAAEARQTNAWQWLERQGARWDAVSAILAGQTQALATVLAENPGEINRQLRGRPLTHLAIVRGGLPTLSLLLKAGADMQAQDERGLSPVGIAQLGQQTEAANFLRQQGAKANLYDAAYNGLAENTRALLDANPSLVNTTNSLGRTPLATAAGCGQLEVLELLLAKGARLEAADPVNHFTALHLAAAYDQTAAAQFLLNKGAQVNPVDRFGLTPLHQAAARGAANVIGLLLQHQADPNQPAAKPAAPQLQEVPPSYAIYNQLREAPPLHYATYMLQTNTTQLLLKSGAKVNATDGLERTALDLLFQTQAGFESYAMMALNQLGGDDPLALHDKFFLPDMRKRSEQRKAIQRLLEEAGAKRSASSRIFGR